MGTLKTPGAFRRALEDGGLRSLSSRNFRLFVAGQSVSLIGSWITRVATSWMVYRMTHSSWLLGFTSFAGQIPLFFVAPIAGVWVDRWDRQRTLIVTQSLSMVQSFVLAALALSGHIQIWHIVILMLLQGVVNAIDMPARQSFVVHMVNSRDDLPNAIALNSSMVNGARLIGPAIAGAIIASLGEGYCFVIDGFSYIAVIISLFLMRVVTLPVIPSGRNVVEELLDGWRYVSRSVAIRSILLLLALSSLLSMPFTVLLPVFAVKILHGNAQTLGALSAAIGVGALMGAVALAARRTVLGLGRVIYLSSGLMALASAAFAYSRSLVLSLMFLALAGFGLMRQLAASNTVIQTIVDENKRGRVMAFYAMAFAGMYPFGSLLAGGAAHYLGEQMAVAICSLLMLVGVFIFARHMPRLRAEIRPIYVRLGLLPESVT